MGYAHGMGFVQGHVSDWFGVPCCDKARSAEKLHVRKQYADVSATACEWVRSKSRVVL
jgi:hypothetical protein